MHPVFVIETVELSIFIYQHTQHNTTTTPLPSLHNFCPMPPKATTRTKKWGQADRDLLADLTNRQLVDITGTSHQNIEQVRDLHFWHRDKKNFRRNFRDYSAAWDLKIEYSGTRGNGGKMLRSILLISCLYTSTDILPPPPPSSIYLDEEVAFDKEGIDDDAAADANDYAAAPAAAAAADAANDNDDENNATMPPKVKPLPTKPTKKDVPAAAAKPLPPAAAAAAAATSFSVDANDPLTAHYYAEGAYDYADVVF
jgi:hypothetical protein